MGVHRELLSESQLDDCLFLATPAESEEAAKDRNREKDQRPHGEAILCDQTDQNQSNLRTRRVYLPWMDLNGGAESPMKSSWTNIENAQATLGNFWH